MVKTFTFEEANRTLVFVAPIVRDLQKISGEILAYNNKDLLSKETDVAGKGIRMRHFMEELQQVGCVLPDPLQPVLEFPSFYKNIPVFLCWRLGEETIGFWHPLHDTGHSRQSVDEDFIHYNSNAPLPDLNLA